MKEDIQVIYRCEVCNDAFNNKTKCEKHETICIAAKQINFIIKELSTQGISVRFGSNTVTSARAYNDCLQLDEHAGTIEVV